jgi:hypothetical protein
MPGDRLSARTMPPFQSLYPAALGAVNVGLGWLLYSELASPVGLLLLAAGALVAVAVLATTASRSVGRVRTGS